MATLRLLRVPVIQQLDPSSVKLLSVQSIEQVDASSLRLLGGSLELQPVSTLRLIGVPFVEAQPSGARVNLRVAGVSVAGVVRVNVAGEPTMCQLTVKGVSPEDPPPDPDPDPDPPPPTGPTMQLQSGVLHVMRVTLPAAQTIRGITIFPQSTAQGLQHLWGCLISRPTMVKFVDTDNSLTPLQAGVPRTLEFPEPFQLTNPLDAYIGVCCVADTMPLVTEAVSAAEGGTSTTGLGKPGSLKLGFVASAVVPSTPFHGAVAYA